MKILPKMLAAAILCAAPAFGAFAHDYKAGNLEINHPASRATLAGAPVGGGFMKIVNHGKEADRLVSITSPVSDDVQLHEMAMENDVMKMRQLKDGIEIPAGAAVELKPGGLHVMFMAIKQPFKEGEKFAATLNFEKAGPVAVEFDVGPPKKKDEKQHGQKEGEVHKM
ncbi:copper chaperone PCu(A)C [Rhizobium sp. ARZ01]|uniref:copper chaperone PCu(A)C n=1 Tax=Rhizobium sp. ARZ01 TaxID=2769313 RepID=UPI00178069A1|nr:copper chaperone PCu(A)C [Rhizobium sp. ARZ01]MBD9371417.1 copper chaperone PCu(A)C [Rhizobium sp. ARZ01]